MRLTQLGATAALATIGHAFLIPSTISSADTNDVYTLPFDVKAVTTTRKLGIACPGCPIEGINMSKQGQRNVESVLQFNFTVEHGDTDKVMVNNLQVYPIDSSIDRLATSLKADQFIIGPGNVLAYTSTQNLGYAVRMRHPFSEATESKNGLSLVSIHVEIIEVGYEFIRGIPGLDLFIVETKEGKLMIGDVTVSMPKSSSPRPANSNHEECTTLLCKWKAIISAKTSSFRKGCGKAKGHGMPRPHGIMGGPNKFPHHRPHKGSFHDDKPHHHRHHRGVIATLFRGLFFHFIVPILIGIFIGILASVVGMVVGHIVVFTWRLLFRRGERGQYCRVKQDETLVEGEDETKGFLEHQDTPPVYEEASVPTDEKTEQK